MSSFDATTLADANARTMWNSGKSQRHWAGFQFQAVRWSRPFRRCHKQDPTAALNKYARQPGRANPYTQTLSAQEGLTVADLTTWPGPDSQQETAWEVSRCVV